MIHTHAANDEWPGLMCDLGGSVPGSGQNAPPIAVSSFVARPPHFLFFGLGSV